MLHAVYCGADVAPLIKFLKEIEDGTIVMMAAFDDPATKYFFCVFQCISSLASPTLLPVTCHMSCIVVNVASCSYRSPSVPQTQRGSPAFNFRPGQLSCQHSGLQGQLDLCGRERHQDKDSIRAGNISHPSFVHTCFYRFCRIIHNDERH